MFVDHAGQTAGVIDRLTGDTRDAYVFVAVLGASSYTYAEATWTRGLRDWISSHVRAFDFFQGCTRLVVPDNWKSGVKQPCYYEPELNRTYNDLALHYGVGILPARPYHARDKAKVEAGVQVVQRWVLAALRKRQFFSLAELNEAIGELIGKLNRRPFHKLPGTREELYRSIDVPALQPLPAQPYVFAEWKRARVSIDYHIDLERHYYSVPYQLVGKEVEVRYTGTTVEILYQGKRVASHAHSNRPGKHSTVPEHRPKAHQKYLEWTPSRIVEWAATIGPFTAQLAGMIMAERPHPEQGYRSCMGLIGLGRRYGKDRLEAAALPALVGAGRGLAPADGDAGGRLAEFRRALQSAGGPALDLAGKPGHGTSPEEIQAGRRALRGRYRSPASPRVGSFVDPHPQQLAMGGPTSLPAVYGPDRDRQVVVSTGPGTEGLPGWIHRVVSAGSEIVPGSDDRACRWKLGSGVGNHRPHGCPSRG